MDTKDRHIFDAIKQFQFVARKFAQVEEMPIPVEPGFEVTTKEAHTIEAVGQKQPVNVTEIAVIFGVSRSAASQIVNKLHIKGLLEKKLAPHSEKELQLTLTPLGQRVFDAHKHFHGADQELLMDRLRGFSQSQIATVSELLKAIDEVMDKRLASKRQS
ncbi:MAG: MarR family transcriptional regulator [Desulfovibrio sp. MES5]|uniref:MarR family winged helix-turn-helix transcriptional regulator n=1 Tax=Desulfovibrio sp. MES5 TaxID=1899016 RepID=UPI000B9D0157|nr:MarR family transcriptional regulator [Desulfovibrio sp. MES5]OXS28378.1 MAG: MarR family transcriptional regulator [Desulfovibrio sp. MES5]